MSNKYSSHEGACSVIVVYTCFSGQKLLYLFSLIRSLAKITNTFSQSLTSQANNNCISSFLKNAKLEHLLICALQPLVHTEMKKNSHYQLIVQPRPPYSHAHLYYRAILDLDYGIPNLIVFAVGNRSNPDMTYSHFDDEWLVVRAHCDYP